MHTFTMYVYVCVSRTFLMFRFENNEMHYDGNSCHEFLPFRNFFHRPSQKLMSLGIMGLRLTPSEQYCCGINA